MDNCYYPRISLHIRYAAVPYMLIPDVFSLFASGQFQPEVVTTNVAASNSWRANVRAGYGAGDGPGAREWGGAGDGGGATGMPGMMIC